VLIFWLNLIFLLVDDGFGAFTLLLPAGLAEASVLAAGCRVVCWLVVAACASRTAVSLDLRTRQMRLEQNGTTRLLLISLVSNHTVTPPKLTPALSLRFSLT